MNKIIGLLVMVFMFLPWRPIVAIVAAVLFVNINGTELYGWQAGLAHGLFFLPNLVRHLFDGGYPFQGYQLYYRLSCCLVDSYSWFVHRLAR